jgi:hypothetical protein
MRRSTKPSAEVDPPVRVLAIDPTPAGLVDVPLRIAFKHLWSILRKEHFAGGDLSCEICGVIEQTARLIHAHEVYSFGDLTEVRLERITFICTRCHDAIHFERSRYRCQPPYIQTLTEHYCWVNGGLSKEEFEADFRAAIKLSIAIRNSYFRAKSHPTLNFGPYQGRVDEILARRAYQNSEEALAERTWRKLGLDLKRQR